ncbi:MAG: PAS domain S-box protein [Kofleriaceae bacterium]
MAAGVGDLVHLFEALDRLGDGVVVTRADDRIHYVNHALTRLLGWTRAELVGSPLTILMPDRMRPSHDAGFKRFIHTRESRIIGRPIRVPALHRDGVEVMIDLTLSVTPQVDGELAIIATLRDLRAPMDLEPEGSSSDARPPALIVNTAGQWFHVAASARVELSKRQQILRRMLVKLAEARLASPGRPLSVTELVVTGWPDEQVLPDAAANRVRVAIAKLRRLGLRRMLRSNQDGYFLDPEFSVVVRER